MYVQFFQKTNELHHHLLNQEEVFQFADFLRILWHETKGEVKILP